MRSDRTLAQRFGLRQLERLTASDRAKGGRMTKRQGAGVLLIAVLCGLIGIAWGWAGLVEAQWKSKYWCDLTDATDLLNQYTRARKETGRWPEPEQLYAAFFHLERSTSNGGLRVDTYTRN